MKKSVGMPAFALFLAALILLLPACGSTGGETPPPPPSPEPGVTTLIYAKVGDEGVDWEAVKKFNQTHEDVQIEVKNYTTLSENGKSGVDLLLTELSTGQIPDIIELGTDGQTCQLPYVQLAEKGYLENLWPYIENDPKIGRDRVMEAPLKAAEVNGGLYAVFDSVWLHTLIGLAETVGSRTSWTMQDMMDAFAGMPEGSVLIDDTAPGSAEAVPSLKDYLLSSLMSCFIDMFVDWEAGTCSFDNQQFRNVLEFVSRTPDPDPWREDCKTETEIADQLMERLRSGKIMLHQRGFFRLYHARDYQFELGGKIACVGYPVEDGSVGSYFEPMGIKLSMSSTCKDKDAAWEYIRNTLLPKTSPIPGGDELMYKGIPVNKSLYNRLFKRRAKDKDRTYSVGGQSYPMDPMSDGEIAELEDFFHSITRSSLFLEKDLLDIVRSEASMYFAGDLSQDQAVERIQSRAELYVDEHR